MSSQQVMSVIGNCGGGHELKVFPGKDGKSDATYADVSVACNNKKAGVEVTTWYRCRVYGKDAEAACKYVHKGDQVSMVGQYEFEIWKDKDGKERFTHQIHVKVMTFLSNQKQEETPAKVEVPF